MHFSGASCFRRKVAAELVRCVLKNVLSKPSLLLQFIELGVY